MRRADITYQFRFNTVLTDTGAHDLFLYNTGQIKHLSDSTWNRKQFYSVTRVDEHGTHLLAKDLACPPCNVGKNSIPTYGPLTAEAVHQLGSDSYVFAGQRADGFYVDLGSIFDLGDLRPFQPDFLLKGSAVAGINTLAGLNVHSIAIQVPIRSSPDDGKVPTNYKASDSMIGVWTTASRQKTLILGHPSTAAGPWTQVSRLGNPLINEVDHPDGREGLLEQPGSVAGQGQFSAYYDHPTLAALLNVLYPGAFPNLAAYTAKASNTRPDLDAVLLTGVPAGLFPGFQNYTGSTKADMLRLNVGDQADVAGQGEHPRRRRRRPRRVPERPAGLRRRRQHRAQGGRGGVARRRGEDRSRPTRPAGAALRRRGPASEPATRGELEGVRSQLPRLVPVPGRTRGTASTTRRCRTCRWRADEMVTEAEA